MTPDEQKMLNDLADKVAQMPAPARDPEAEDLIRTKIGKRPDALYLMTQTVLIQGLALQRAQQQMQELQERGSQGQVAGSQSSWLGQRSSGSTPAAPSYSGAGQQQYSAPPPQYAAPAPASGGGSSFLRNAAQTAAGVAAGTLAADAIGSMFSGHGGGMFGGGGGGMFGGGGGSGFLGGNAPSEEIVNNYYDSSGANNDNFGGSDQGNNFVDPGDSNTADAGSFDDNTSFDDGGGFDGGGGDNFV